MTAAERDVALLILKGLSHKEIAALRATTDATVRQQAQAIYRKAGLPGKTAFCAYFLDDLFTAEAATDDRERRAPRAGRGAALGSMTPMPAGAGEPRAPTTDPVGVFYAAIRHLSDMGESDTSRIYANATSRR